MRKYIDLHLKPQPQNRELMIQKAIELGFHQVAITDYQPKETDNVISRIDLTPQNSQELQKSLNKARKNYHIVSVLCLSKKIAEQAARDSRVDILKYIRSSRSRFNKHHAALARDSNTHIEIDVNSIITADPVHLPKLLKLLKREYQTAQKNDVRTLLSSGASSVYDLREPRALAALMSLLDIPEEESLDMISSNPSTLIEKNLSKMNKNYLSPKVWRT
jgi:ribonuclease P/MRP protein subunit RPP1